MSDRIAVGKVEADGNLYLDLPTLVDTRALITGNSGAGKSRLFRRIAEQAFGKVQIIIIDPEGEFPSLREKHAFLLAGRGGEVPAEPRAAALLARRLMELRVSAVVDLYDLRLPQQREFVRIFLDALMTLDKKLYRHTLVMIDEAHKFAPERSAGEAESTDAVIALMSQGRKRGLCGIPATQRLSKLHKDAAAEGNNVFVGRTVLDVDQKRAGDALGLSTQADRLALRDLENGTFLAFGPALDVKGVVTFRGGDVHTTHPKAGQRHKAAETAPPDAIKKLAAELKDLPEQAAEEIRTLQAAQARVRELERDLRAVTKAAPASKEDPAARRQDAARIRALTSALEAAMKFIVEISAEGFFKAAGDKVDPAEIQKALDVALQNITKVIERKLDARNQDVERLRREGQRVLRALRAAVGDDVSVKVNVKHNEPFTVTPAPVRRVSAPATRPSSEPPADGLAATEQRVLDALAWWESAGVDTPSKIQVGFMSGYRVGKDVGGTFGNILGKLRAKGLLDYPGKGAATLTDEGRAVARPPAHAPTTEMLHGAIHARLEATESRVLTAIVDSYPAALRKQEAGAKAGYQVGPDVGGTFGNILGRLRSLGLIDYPGKGEVVALPVLFLEGR